MRLRSKRHLGRATVMALILLIFVAGCGGSSTSGGKKVLRVAYGSTYVFFKPSAASQWWHTVASEFEKAHPNATVQLVPIPGSYNDIVTKLDLLYRTPSTAPDVAQLPGPGQMGNYVSSGFLAPLDQYLSSASWWQHFPQSVKSETTVGGKVYAVNQGENNTGLYYNIPMFKKAGIPVPWQPRNWADIMAAAAKIHRALPNVWPVWLEGGSAGGTGALQFNGANVILGSTTPTIYDQSTKKWVVDSPGLRQALTFYKELAQNGYQAPVSELFNPQAVNSLTNLVAEQKMAIVVGGNYLGQAWAKGTCAPCWPNASKTIGAAYFPTVDGQAPGLVSVLGGNELAIAASSPYKSLAWDFIQIAQQRENMLKTGFGAGWVPSDSRLWTDPTYVNYAPPYQKFFAHLLPKSSLAPELNDYTVWATGFNEATGAIIQSNVSVSHAVAVLKSYVTNQLGGGNVETLP